MWGDLASDDPDDGAAFYLAAAPVSARMILTADILASLAVFAIVAAVAWWARRHSQRYFRN